jgi:hypothetical protein
LLKQVFDVLSRFQPYAAGQAAGTKIKELMVRIHVPSLISL